MNFLWIKLIAICFIVRTVCVSGNILAPKKVIQNVGEDIEFLLNSTGNKPIGASKIRLKDPETKLLAVKQQNGKLTLVYSEDLNSLAGRRFTERVSFIGNFAVGHAWFKITNATIGDSNTFIVSVRRKLEDDDYKHFEVQLIVHSKKGFIMFTQEPPQVLYVQSGSTARFEWDYHVDDRASEFDVNSPKWNFYHSDGEVMCIASEDEFKGWNWVIHTSTCPPRLLRPIRVSKEAIATLAIANVTRADDGMYGCTLMLLKNSSHITSKVKLIVAGAIGIITSPALVTGVVGQDVDFKINTSSPILAIKFGIDGGNELPFPLFITITTLHNGVQCSSDLDIPAAARFKGRVDFVGDIATHAWIRITNLTKDDSMVYKISVRDEQSDYYVSKTIKLLVKEKEAAPTVPTTESKQKPTGRFRYFDGLAEKIIINEKRFQSEKEKREFAKAIKNAYRYHSLYLSDLKITVSKINMTVKVNFFMTFKQTVNLDSAFTILKVAQKRNQLQGYNITCLDITDKPPTVKSKNRSLPPKTLLYWVSVTLSVAAFLVLVLGVYVKYGMKI